MTRRPLPHENHISCERKTCLGNQVEQLTYKTQHVDEMCNCSHHVMDIQAVCNILESGKVPKIVISEASEGDLEFKVLADIPYVVVSHVWSHGLGNPRQNSLPLCQLRRLKNWTDKLASLDGTVGLWIDSMCIPVESQLQGFR